jgi:hypothetical protein
MGLIEVTTPKTLIFYIFQPNYTDANKEEEEEEEVQTT